MSKSSLTSSWIDIDPPLDGNLKTSDVYTRREIILRVVIFTLLEVGFVILSAKALVHPIVLDIPTHLTLTETKGAFQLLFIIWHALAAMTIKDLVAYIFSSEWTFIYDKTGVLNSDITDRASKLTSGLITQLHHFLSKLATKRFRIALALALLLMALNGQGPSTVFVTTSFIDIPTQVPLANVSLAQPGVGRVVPLNFQLALQRADILLRMELFDKTTFGYSTKENLFIPWPKVPPGLTAGRLVYETDVLDFTYSCTYHAPLGPPTSNTTSAVALSDLEWLLDDSFVYETGLLNARASTVQNIIPVFPKTGSPLTFGIMFVEHPNQSSENVDLTGIPSFFLGPQETALAFGLAPNSTDQTTESLGASVVLLCSPKFESYTAKVTLFNNTLSTEKIDSKPRVGNLNVAALTRMGEILIVSLTAFMDSFSSKFHTFSSVSRLLLFCQADDPCDGTLLKPLPPSVITANVNRFYRSSIKAFLDGYNGTQVGVGTLSVPGFNTFISDAVGQEERTVLVTSVPIFSLFMAIFMMIEVFLIAFLILADPQGLKCFNIDNVVEVLNYK